MGFADLKHSIRGNISYPVVAEGCLFNFGSSPKVGIRERNFKKTGTDTI